jgi:phosphotransferase system enzyme I (PtsI)
MIIDTEQFLKLKTLFTESVKDLKTGNIKHGVMFEVPSACFDADELLTAADFGSIGTNDLIQYMYAVDRNNEHVAYDFKPERKSFWKLIKLIVESAERNGKPLSVCGELASDFDFIKRLMQIGVNQISVSPRLIPGIRARIIENA